MTLWKLKNGTVIENEIVHRWANNIHSLMGMDITLAVQLALRCADEKYEISEEGQDFLKEFEFIDEEGNIDPDVKNIMLSAVEITGKSVKFTAPVVGLYTGNHTDYRLN